MGVMFVAFLLVCLQPALARRYREDGLCGPGSLAEDGDPADCQHIPPFPTCCQKNGHCGWDCDAGDAPAAIDVGRPATAFPPVAPVFTSTGLYRSDGKCGAAFPLEDGTPAECDPNSEYWCCSEHGFCGGTQEHCYCDTCVNYRPVEQNGKVRSDRRCGNDFPLSDGSPSECLGTSPNYCCSKFGYCGPGPDHCECPECVDYRQSQAARNNLVSAGGKVRGDRRCGTEFPLPDGSPSECDGNGPNHCCSKWG